MYVKKLNNTYNASDGNFLKKTKQSESGIYQMHQKFTNVRKIDKLSRYIFLIQTENPKSLNKPFNLRI